MKRWWRRVRRSFLAGLLVVVPVAAAFFVVAWVFRVVTDLLLPSTVEDRGQTLVPRLAALAAFVLLVTLVGWAMRWVAGRRLMAAAERVIERVPLWNQTYRFIRDVSDTFLGDKASLFRRVVLVEYPRPGLYTLGFATAETGGEVEARTSSTSVSVFLPTPPNPTTGYLGLFPREQVAELDMGVTDAVKMVFSGGAVVPPYPPPSAAGAGAAD
ncbi:MAG: DUF502 domain-containing protein [Phycisphaerae bacterium]|nr:DUF502 domain-containing protein [Phycisphaerae bacterium]